MTDATLELADATRGLPEGSDTCLHVRTNPPYVVWAGDEHYWLWTQSPCGTWHPEPVPFEMAEVAAYRVGPDPVTSVERTKLPDVLPADRFKRPSTDDD